MYDENGWTSQSQCVAFFGPHNRSVWYLSSHKTLLLYNQFNMVSAISTLVGEELEGRTKWSRIFAAPNGYLYGIPRIARRVVKFNPVDKSMTHIRPDFGNGVQWHRGAMTASGVIYCPSAMMNSNRGILKIDTNTDTSIELNANLLPESNLLLEEPEEGMCEGMWGSCAVALDGCIYFMPATARGIMKLDPNIGDAISSVGDDLGNGLGYCRYMGTVVGIDGCVYGMPYYSKRILKYDPINDITSYVGEEADRDFVCSGDGA